MRDTKMNDIRDRSIQTRICTDLHGQLVMSQKAIAETPAQEGRGKSPAPLAMCENDGIGNPGAFHPIISPHDRKGRLGRPLLCWTGSQAVSTQLSAVSPADIPQS